MAFLRRIAARGDHAFYLALLERHAPAPAVNVADLAAVGGGGLGDFAIVYGYRAFEWEVTVVATLIIIVLVQAAQFFGNWLSAKIMRR